MSVAEFAKFYDDEFAKWGKVVKAAEISRSQRAIAFVPAKAGTQGSE